MASALSSKDMEKMLFKNVEQIKRDTHGILARLENSEILLKQYVEEVYGMRGEKEDDPR